jgi:ABC-type multidrug transport system ATPase subunit
MQATTPASRAIAAGGVRIDARGVGRIARGKRGEVAILSDISLTIFPGELVAIAGGSGEGKTTLLNLLAGMQAPSTGAVQYNGVDLQQNLRFFRSRLGYVPQEDIVHPELTARRTLDYAAKLRLPADTMPQERRAAVDRSLSELGLSSQAEQSVGSLSGGQRKRASIGVELLTHPRVFFLDEPTSGLDPANGRGLLRNLRQLAKEEGSTIVLTTHAPQDIAFCDRVLFLKGGRLAFNGRPEESLAYFGASSHDEIYERLNQEVTPEGWADRFRQSNGTVAAPHLKESAEPGSRSSPVSNFRQWRVLTQRHFEILFRNRLTLAILVGSPIAVIAMFIMLFQPGAFDFQHPSPPAVLQILYWIAFAAFFFGLTYGLLQIATEIAIFRRERLVNLNLLPYVLSKITVLAPILSLVLLADIVVLRLLDRLPGDSLIVYGEVFLTAILCGTAAIALGLLASAAVTDPVQVTLALPMLCWPQVLFSGGMLPVPVMAAVGRAISYFTSARWAFEGLGKSLDIETLFAKGSSEVGPPLLAQYGDSFSRAVWQDWLILAAFTVVCLSATCWVLNGKSAR